MPRLTGGQAIVRQLEREGVDTVFGIPGVHTLAIYDALLDSDIRPITTRHEQGAGFMADGYARATGRVGVLLLITGPGLTNAATAIGQAYSDSSPLVVVSSHHATTDADRGAGLLHELKDQQGLMGNLVAHTERVDRVRDVPRAIAAAFDRVETRRPRPVHVDVPLDVLERASEIELAPRPAARDRSRPAPDPERLDRAVELLESAAAPLLLVGGGSMGAADAVRGFVEATGIPTLTTVNGKGTLPADHPRHYGTIGRPDVDDVIANRDLSMAVGTELSPRDLDGIELPDDRIHIDVDPRVIGRDRSTTVGIVADAAASLRALTERIDPPDRWADTAPAPVTTDGHWALWPTKDPDDRHRVLAALRTALRDADVVVHDMTKLSYAATTAYPVGAPRSFQFPRGFGTLGFSPPAAYGAALGVRGTDRRVVSVVGDGGLLFTVQDLATAVKYGLGVPVVVLNDDSYDVVREVQHREYGRSVGTDIRNPDFVEMARSYGAAAERIGLESIDETLPAALERAFRRDGPTLIEIPVGF